MGIRRQAYEWRAAVPKEVYDAGDTFTKGISVFTPPIEGASQVNQIIQPALPPGGCSIFIGGFGNNLEIPAELRASQFVVIDEVSGWDGQAGGAFKLKRNPPTIPPTPPSFEKIYQSPNQDSFIQIRVNTSHYFQNPDRTVSDGLSTATVPFPDRNGQNRTLLSMDIQATQSIYTFESFQNGLPCPVYVLPGQTWDIIYTNKKESVNMAVTDDSKFSACFVKYLLLDGSDAMIGMQLLRSGFPVTVENVKAYRRMLIRDDLFRDSQLPSPIGFRRVE